MQVRTSVMSHAAIYAGVLSYGLLRPMQHAWDQFFTVSPFLSVEAVEDIVRLQDRLRVLASTRGDDVVRAATYYEGMLTRLMLEDTEGMEVALYTVELFLLYHALER